MHTATFSKITNGALYGANTAFLFSVQKSEENFQDQGKYKWKFFSMNTGAMVQPLRALAADIYLCVGLFVMKMVHCQFTRDIQYKCSIS